MSELEPQLGAAQPSDPEHVDELVDDQADELAGAPELEEPSPATPGFTIGEKIGSVINHVWNAPPPDARVGAVMGLVKRLEKFGLLNPMKSMFPPLDNEDAWQALSTIFVGVALELQSDGHEVDIAEAKEAGQFVLANLFAQDD